MVTKILLEVEYNNGKCPREVLRRAIAQREEIIPELLEILEFTCENAETLAKEDNYFAHIYALYLLAQFRERRAYPLLNNLLNKPAELVDSLLGDMVTEGLPSILASIYDGDVNLLHKIIGNEEIDGYIRGSALHALVALVAQRRIVREEVVEYFRELFNGGLEREYSHVWNALVGCSNYLYPEEIIRDIEQAYDEELVDLGYIEYEEIKNQLARSKDIALAELYKNRNYQLIDDTIQELEYWACFYKKENNRRLVHSDSLELDGQLTMFQDSMERVTQEPDVAK